MILPWTLPSSHAVARSARFVEWLALLWWLAGDDPSHCANPSLAHLAAERAGLRDAFALGLVRLLRAQCSRDSAVKAMVAQLHQLDSPSVQPAVRDVTAALAARIAELDERPLPSRDPSLLAADSALHQLVQRLAQGLDPAADVAAVTGAACPLTVVLVPSLFLPPPQDGRHGMSVPTSDGTLAYMCFGLPLRQDLWRYGIDAQFLCFGAWHYALARFMNDAWPRAEAELRLAGKVEEVFENSFRPGRQLPWPGAVQAHLKMALRSHLAERIGGKRAHMQQLARAFALPHFDWFVSWLDQLQASEIELSQGLTQLPAALDAAVADGSLKHIATTVPMAINLTIISQRDAPVSLVVPDDWDKELVARVARGWSALAADVVKHGQFEQSQQQASCAVVAFGRPDNNPLVARTLTRRQLTLPESDSEVLMALVPAGDEQPQWCIAVGSQQPEAAAAVTLEVATRLTCSYAVLDGSRVVTADGVTGGL